MDLAVVIPNVEPGWAFAIEPSQLPPGTGGLRIGAVYSVVRTDGRPADILIDTARWGEDGRIYDAVVIAERIDAISAIRTIDALVDHLATTGGRIILTRASVDLAILTPAAPDPAQPPGWRDGVHLRAVAAAHDAHEAAEDALTQTITAAHEAGDSWEMIAAAMDQPVDTVQARFARDADE